MVTLTRKELYDRVWDKPMRTLATEFGLSDVALHMICRKHDIPTPPVGFWAKKEYGKPVKVTALPHARDQGDERIVIHEGAASNESAAMSEARALMRERLAGDAESPTGRAAIVGRSIAALSKAKIDRLGLVHSEGKGRLAVTVRPQSLERAAAILDQLVSAGAKTGIELEEREGSASWMIDGETITFELVELPDRVEHVATAMELAAVAKWERERQATYRRSGYWQDWGEPKIPKWEDRYQGRLAIRLEEVRVRSERNWWGQAIRRQFADRSKRDVTKDIPRIIEAIAAIAVAKRENRELEERQRAEAAERERQRVEAERRRLLEEKRVQLLAQLTAEQAEVGQLTRLLEMLEQSPERSQRVDALLAWIRERRATKLRRLSPEMLELCLAEAELFDESSDGNFAGADSRRIVPCAER